MSGRAPRAQALFDERPPLVLSFDQLSDEATGVGVLFRDRLQGAGGLPDSLHNRRDDIDRLSLLIGVGLEAWFGLEASPPIEQNAKSSLPRWPRVLGDDLQ